MNAPEHLIVLVSIIIGLAIGDLLTSFHKLVRARDRVTFHWLPLTWAVLVFLQLVQFWWVYYFMIQDEVWTSYFAYVFFLLVPMLLFLIASWILPDQDTTEPLDLKEYYLRESGWIFGLISLAAAIHFAGEFFQGGSLFHPARIIQFLALALFLTLAWTRDIRYHTVITIFLIVLFISFAVLYTVRLG